MTLALDAGSTTLEIAKEIRDGLMMDRWNNLKIVTSSIPVAYELLRVADDRGLEDNNAFLKLYIAGGRVRLNTQAVVCVDSLPVDERIGDTASILKALGRAAEIAFVGTNGISWDAGFTTSTEVEQYAKVAMLSSAEAKIVVADQSKFGLQQELVFGSFEEGIEIITTNDSNVVQKWQERLEKTLTTITCV